jgi:hypothetical protein
MGMTVMPKWKSRMRRLARQGYIVSLTREIDPRDGDALYCAEASVALEGAYESSLCEMGRSFWFSKPDEALMDLQRELGISEEELWDA